MKVGFLTLGMPDWPAAAFATRARELGCDGVAFRCTPPENGRPSLGGQVCIETSDEELDEIERLYDRVGVEIPGLLCSNGKRGRMGIDSDKIDWDEVEAELVAYVRVARKLGCEHIGFQLERADERPGPDLKWDWNDYLDRMGRASLAAINGTRLRATFQNHVSSATAGQLIQMVERIGDARLGVILSPDHCIVMQEDPVRLAEDHTDVIAHFYVADRRIVKPGLGDFDGRYYNVQYECCGIGEGIVPNARIFDALARRNWNGYAYLKWEKSESFGWQLPEGEAVLEPYIKFMKSLAVSGALAFH
ncbi:MAG TPA: sugar phosphate isomerase/epimerase [Dehalococcoidia bacterium]|nr:sugar phosphate isomerase/epimerase [Dehalococcoidia bacterium]